MRKIWHDRAWEEYIEWQSKDKKTLKRINRLLQEIDRNGYLCIGKPEPLLKYDKIILLKEKIESFFE